MPENFYNEKAARGLIGRFKIVVCGMATGGLRDSSFGTRIGTERLSTEQDRAGQDATATGLKPQGTSLSGMERDEPARRQAHFETAPFDSFGTAWSAIRGEAERSAPRGSARPLTAGSADG
jgi:hypothetical protein